MRSLATRFPILAPDHARSALLRCWLRVAVKLDRLYRPDAREIRSRYDSGV